MDAHELDSRLILICEKHVIQRAKFERRRDSCGLRLSARHVGEEFAPLPCTLNVLTVYCYIFAESLSITIYDEPFTLGPS